MSKKNFYGVHTGKTPGVYKTWAECKSQIDHFPGAKYKGFETKEEAEAFVSSSIAPYTRSAKPKEPKKPSVFQVPEGPYSFVDGSFNSDTKVYGYGGFLHVDGQHHFLEGNGTESSMASMRNVAGEICGAMAAVKKAEELNLSHLTILYDYNGIEMWATKKWKTNKVGTTDYATFMLSPDRTVTISFQHVDAHTGIDGNETADAIAKHAVGINLTPSQQELYQKALDNSNE